MSPIYTIRCRPNRHNHLDHYVGIFTTYEEAIYFIPPGFVSTDLNNDCTWHYSVEIFESYTLPGGISPVIPKYFPYRGW
jgi:hypothetical protein